MGEMTKEQLAKFHKAAKMIETDGIEAYQTVCQKYGDDIAGALLVAFLRSETGSRDVECELDEQEIQGATNNVLRENKILAGEYRTGPLRDLV